MKKIILIALLSLSGYWLKAQINISFSNYVPSCNNDGGVDATATGGTAPYTYAWYLYPNTTVPVATGSSLTNSPGGYYYVIATDANSVSSQQNGTYVSQVLQVYVSGTTDAHCPASDGSASYTVNNGSAPYDFVWSNGQSFLAQSANVSTITNVPQGQYSVMVTDGNGCVFNHTDSVATVYGIAPFSVSTSATPANCNDGTITANITGSGTAPYTYYWNTTPPQTTTTATGLDGNNYYYATVTDANGCNTSSGSYVNYGPTALQLSASITDAVCPSYTNGAINMTVSNGNPPYTYAWSNGSTTQDLTGLIPGSYTLTVSDNAGCHITVVKHIGQNSPVYAYVTTTPTGCSNNTGSATVHPSGGVGPYTYNWGGGQTSTTISGLSAGYYSAYVMDANGCPNLNSSSYGYVSIPASCYNYVSGSVINDMDGNCSLNGGETGLPWQIVDLGNGLYASTGYNGAYQYGSLGAGTYTVSHTPSNSNWNLLCPASSYTVNALAGQNIGGNDFYDQPTSLQNSLSIYVYGGTARPGFNHSKSYSIHNSGTTSMSGTIEITHDAQEVFLGGANVSGYNPATRTITLTYNSLAPFAGTYGQLNFSLPSTVAIGNILTTTAVVNPVAGDLDPIDNYDTSTVTVVGSYDPNAKEVSPKGIGSAGLISANNTNLDYIIHFQNTGTYMAQTVVVVDTLDQDLDIPSFQLLGASHNVTWELTGPRIVKFTFDYIYLADSLSDEPASHGMVAYRIKQKQNLSAGTEIKNTAYIYFDYNVPVVTNTTLNTIQVVGIKENAFNSGLTISPNPAQDRFTLTNKTKEACSKVEIMDISGRIVASVIPAGTSVQLPEMASGVYIINAHYNSGIYKEKLIISK